MQKYNRRVQSFPSAFDARSFGFREEEFFEIPAAERAVVGTAPRVDFGFRGDQAGSGAETGAPAPGGGGPPEDQGTVIDQPIPPGPPPSPGAPTPPPPPEGGGTSA